MRQLQEKKLKATVTLRDCWKIIEQEYRDYELRYRKPVLFKELKRAGKVSARLLNELYDRKIDCFSYIQNLRDNANKLLQSCPYCGLPSMLTLDHYLPRSVNRFPHLSVLTANLVPACMPCQIAKGSFYPGFSKVRRTRTRPQVTAHRKPLAKPIRGAFNRRLAGKARLTREARILHPYFDEIYSTRMLRLVEANGLQVLAASKSYYRKYRLVSFHVEKLGMATRTLRQVNMTLDYVVASLQAHEVKNFDEARQIARKLLSTAYGANRQGGSIDILVRHAVVDNAGLLSDLLVKSQATPPVLILESQVVDLSVGMSWP